MIGCHLQSLIISGSILMIHGLCPRFQTLYTSSEGGVDYWREDIDRGVSSAKIP